MRARHPGPVAVAIRAVARTMRLALVGCGAIGAALLDLLADDSEIKVAAIVLRDPSKAPTSLARLRGTPKCTDAVPTQGIDLVLEAAGHGAITQHVLPALARGVPAIVCSVGALSAPGLPQALEAASRAGRTQLQLIPGAIGAIDALTAAAVGGLDMVRYTGCKPPRAWRGTPAERSHALDALHAPTVVFEGSAREAAARYPKNANVAATVALSGMGLDRTEVRLVADPGATMNTHRLEASGAFGRFDFTLHNAPLPANPKTSALTVYSAVRALRQRVMPLALR